MSQSGTHARPLIEVCVGSVADAVQAESAGADRLELCGATELGGLTPSLGLVQQVLQAVDIPVVAMVRPRAGGFCYRDDEFQTAREEGKLLLEAGVAGLVFGFLCSDGQVDSDRTAEFVILTEGVDAVFHRAFDFTPEPLAACDQLSDLGITRLLTSGQAGDALSGAALIRSLIERAPDGMDILPCGGVRADQAPKLREITGCRQLHIGGSVARSDRSLEGNQQIDLCSANCLQHGCHQAVDATVVADVVASLAGNNVK